MCTGELQSRPERFGSIAWTLNAARCGLFSIFMAGTLQAQQSDIPQAHDAKTLGIIETLQNWTVTVQGHSIAAAGDVFDVHLIPPAKSDDGVKEGYVFARRQLSELEGKARLIRAETSADLDVTPGRPTRLRLQLETEGFAAGDEIHAAFFVGMRDGLLFEKFPRAFFDNVPGFNTATMIAKQVEIDGPYLTSANDSALGPQYVRIAADAAQFRIDAEFKSGSASSFVFGERHFPAFSAVSMNHLTNGVSNYLRALPQTKSKQEPDKNADKQDAFRLSNLQVTSMLAKSTIHDPAGSYADVAALLSDAPVYFNFIHLTTVAGQGQEAVPVFVDVTPPDLPFEYDSIVLVPVHVSRNSSGNAEVLANTESMPPLTLAVAAQPGKSVFPKSFVDEDAVPKPQMPPEQPKMVIETGPNHWIDLGHRVRLPFRVRHGPAPVGAEIYVMLAPISQIGNKLLLGSDKGITELDVRAGNLSVDTCGLEPELRSDFMWIQEAPIQIRSEDLWNTGFDAGRLGTITSTDEGAIEGYLTFHAPFGTPILYDRIRAFPLMMVWNEETGHLCTQADLRPEDGIDIPVRYLQFGVLKTPGTAQSQD